jgi:hypothetical protein
MSCFAQINFFEWVIAILLVILAASVAANLIWGIVLRRAVRDGDPFVRPFGDVPRPAWSASSEMRMRATAPPPPPDQDYSWNGGREQ